jgi:putative effector of murein hydrolase LrgA (UPF0299 family)
MSNMTENQRSQFERYDLRETRPTRLTSVSEGGQRILAGLTLLFVGVLAALTYAAVQIFDGWHHLIVIADFVIVFFAIAAWIYSTRTA